MRLDEPFLIRLAHPGGRRIVVVVLHLGLVACAAVEGADHVVNRKSGVRGEDADLQVTKFVGLEFAMLQVDQKRIDGLNLVVDFNEVLGEEAAYCGEVAFGDGSPKMLFEIDDLYRRRRRILRTTWSG